MTTESKLKRRINWQSWAIPLLFLTILIIEKEALGTFYSSWLYGLILIFFGIMYSLRYKLFQPVVIGCLAGITLWHYVLSAHYDICIMMIQILGIDVELNATNSPFSMMIWMINLLIFLILIPILGPAILKAFKLEQGAKRIFRTAAQTVIATGNGFTGRPYVAGNSSAPEAQITGFAQYLSEQKLVYPKFIEPGVFLTFSMGKSPLANGEINDLSYFAFENNGKLTVHISQKDYKRFRKQLTFDKLCDSLADLFKRFFGYYANNQEARIIMELQSP